jgi:hypothetical protein
MGAALTYARRYALFTLVGIAGEDDLEAPDLGGVPNPAAELTRSNREAAVTRRTVPSARSVLGEQLSASLRESLIQQMAAINSQDEATAWAHRNIAAKNTLTAADAKIVEERFQARLFEISDGRAGGRACDGPDPAETPDPLAPGEALHAVAGQGVISAGKPDARGNQKAAGVGRSRSSPIVALGKTVRLRNKDHRKFVLRQPCLVCGRVPSDPHHLSYTQPRALGRRVSDEFTVPVCRVHHRELHRSGDEAAWWQRLNIDPLPVALKLWQQRTRGDSEPANSRKNVSQAQVAKAPDRQDRSDLSMQPILPSASSVDS